MAGGTTVGGLVVVVSSDVQQFTDGMKQAESTTASTTAAITSGLQGVSVETDKLTGYGKRLVEQLNEEIRTFGMSREEILIYKASLTGSGAEVQRLADQLTSLKMAQAQSNADMREASSALRSHGQAANEATHATHEFNFATVGAKRELLVLAHELSQGNYKKFGGSMMVLGEQTGAAGLLFSAAGLAAIGMGAALIGVSIAVAHGASEQKAMNDALIVTGNYAGQTSDSLNAMAHAAVESGGSLGEAKKAATQLAASGKFTGEQIGTVTAAVVAMEHATGASIEETIKQFESLSVQAQGHSARASTAISQATVKLDEQYHFLTLSVYDQITALEKEGDLKGASRLATEEFARITKARAEEIVGNLGNVAKAWNLIKEVIGDATSALGDMGKKTTAAMEVARLTNKLYGPSAQVDNIGFAGDQRRIEIENLAIWQGRLNHENKIAADQAAGTLAQSNAVQAAQRIDEMLLRAQAKEQGALTTALKEYHESLDRIRAGSTTEDIDPRLTERAIAAGESALRKLHSQAVKGNDDRASRLQDALLLEQTALEREKGIYDSRDKMLALYHSKFGISDSDFYSGREAARAEYVASEAIAFSKESALIQGYKPKNAEEIAANKTKYDQLLKQHLKFVDDMRSAGGEDSVGVAAATKKLFDAQYNAIAAAGDAEVKSLDTAIAKQREHNAEIGKTAAQIELAKQTQADAGTALLQVEDDAIRALLTQTDLQGVLIGSDRDLYAQRLAYLDSEISKRKELAALLGSGAILEADAKAAAEASKAWKHTATTIENDLTNAILDGGGHGFKKLIRDMELAFARMILSPILQPISAGITSYLNPLASQAQAGGATGATSLIGAASNAYSIFTGGMSLAGGIGTGFMGSVSGGLMGAGVGSGLTSATGLAIGESIAGVVGPAAAGAISSGMGMVAAAMPWLATAAIAAAVLKFGFGHGERETTSSTLTGSFGSNGFSGATNDSWKEKGGWFSSDKTGVTSTGVDAATAKQFGDGYKAMQTASTQFAQALGVDASSIMTRSQSISIALTKDAAANKQAIADFFAGVGNSMATELVPNLADFAKAGEAASATLQRLAGDFQATDQFAAMLGKSAADVFGAVGIASATARERLIDLSGGVAALGSKAQAYSQAFLTDAEKIAPVIKTVGAAMDSLALSGVTTKDQFKAIVNGLNLATEAGAQEYASLMNLAPAFAQAADYADNLTAATIAKAQSDKAAADALAASIAKEQRGLDIQLMTAMGDAEGALAATRSDALAALLSDQTRATQVQIWAANDAAAAIAKAQATAATQQTVLAAQQAAAATANQSFGAALVGAMTNATAAAKALRAFNDSLLLGNLSSLSKGAQYDVAKQAFAANGDQASATAFLQASQANGGSKLDYARDFAMVIANNSAKAAAQDATAAAIPMMWAAFNSMNGSHASGLNYVPFDGYRAILHKGESVKTAAETRSAATSGGGMSEETGQKLLKAFEAVAINTNATVKKLNRIAPDDVLQTTTVAA